MIRTYSKAQLDAMIAGGLTGPPGPPGTAYTTTSAGFTQPASGANVTVSVGDTSWMVPGQELYVATGGYYAVSSITNATTVVLTNSGYPGSASPGATINSGSKVSPGGVQGPSGASGAYSTIQEDGTPLTQRTTLNFGSNITAADNSGATRTDVSVPSASDTTPGAVELATDAETQTGTDTARAVTPANLTARSATETRTGVAEIATQAEADAGTDDVRIMTPLKSANMLRVSPIEVSVTGTTTLTSTAFGKLHACSGTSADYTVTLPSPTGNTGKIIAFRGVSGLTKFVTLDNSGAVAYVLANEFIILECIGTGYVVGPSSSRKPRNAMTPYRSSTDIVSGLALTANTWTNIGPQHTFILVEANAMVSIIYGGGIIVFATALHNSYSRILVDGTSYTMGGSSGAANDYSPPLAGVQPLWFSALAAGSHTLQLQIKDSSSTATAYARAATEPAEAIYANVIEYR